MVVYPMFFRRRSRRAKVSPLEPIEMGFVATGILTAVGSVATSVATQDPKWLLGLAIASLVPTVGSNIASLRGKFRAWIGAKSNAQGREGADPYVANPEKGDARSYLSDPNARFDLVAFLGGTSLKGVGGDIRPAAGVQDRAESGINREMEIVDIAMTGSGMDDLNRQAEVADKHAIRRVGADYRALVIDLGNQAVVTGEHSGINKHLRPILNEWTDPTDFNMRPVVEGGANIIIVPPNAFKRVTAPDGKPMFFGQMVGEYRERADREYDELISYISGYRRTHPDRAAKIVVLPRPTEIAFTAEHGFHLPTSA